MEASVVKSVQISLLTRCYRGNMMGHGEFGDFLCGLSQRRQNPSSLSEAFDKHSVHQFCPGFQSGLVLSWKFVITQPACPPFSPDFYSNFLSGLSRVFILFYFSLSLHNSSLFFTWTLFLPTSIARFYFRSQVIWDLLLRKRLTFLVEMWFSTQRLM